MANAANNAQRTQQNLGVQASLAQANDFNLQQQAGIHQEQKAQQLALGGLYGQQAIGAPVPYLPIGAGPGFYPDPSFGQGFGGLPPPPLGGPFF